MALPRRQRGESQGDRAPRGGAQPTIGTTLLVLDESMDLAAIVLALRAGGLRPVIMPAAEDAKEIVSRWQPEGVILRAGRPDWRALLRFLGRRQTPCVLIGSPGQLRGAERLHPGCVQLLVPVEPEEIAQGARLVIGPTASGTLPEVIDLGVVRIDVAARIVEIEGDRKVLPPKEFEILVQLALRPGSPIDSTELRDRVWRGSKSATVEDVHKAIWRLRRLIGDHQRPSPLIVNRRGFGYLLNLTRSPAAEP